MLLVKGKLWKSPLWHNQGERPHLRFIATNMLLGNPKMRTNTVFRGLKICYQAMRYTAEFQCRFSRRFDLAQLMSSSFGACAVQRAAD